MPLRWLSKASNGVTLNFTVRSTAGNTSATLHSMPLVEDGKQGTPA
jgi:hypothetical protein